MQNAIIKISQCGRASQYLLLVDGRGTIFYPPWLGDQRGIAFSRYSDTTNSSVLFHSCDSLQYSAMTTSSHESFFRLLSFYSRCLGIWPWNRDGTIKTQRSRFDISMVLMMCIYFVCENIRLITSNYKPLKMPSFCKLFLTTAELWFIQSGWKCLSGILQEFAASYRTSTTGIMEIHSLV